MPTVHRRLSRTVSASSMGALFIRLLFIGAFVYAWFLIARTSSSENNAVLFGEDIFTDKKRVHGNHLEAEKLIPVDNPNGLPEATTPPTHPLFHEDKFLQEPPSEGFVGNRHKPVSTEWFTDTNQPLRSAANERQQYGMVKYETNIKPALKQSVSEKNTVNVQVQNEIKSSNNLVDTETNTPNDTYVREQYSTTVAPRNSESPTTISVFSNFKDKLLNIIMPKSDVDQPSRTNFTRDTKAEAGSHENSTRSPVKASSDTEPAVPTQSWTENNRQVNIRQHYTFKKQSIKNLQKSDSYILQEEDDGTKLSDKTKISNKQLYGQTLEDKVQPDSEYRLSTPVIPNKRFYGKNLEETTRPSVEYKTGSQSSLNQYVREDTKLPQQISEKFHMKPPTLAKQHTAEAMVQRKGSGDGVCPTGDIITVVGGGRLANCIWEYVSLWSLNKFLPGNRTAYAQKYVIEYMKNIFDNINMPVVENIPEDCSCCKNINWTASNIHMYSLILLKDVCKKFENVPGHIILPRYVVLIEPVLATMKRLKKELTYKDSLVQYAQNIIKSKTEEFLEKHDIRRSKLTYVGVHVRRTDYKIYLQSKYNMTALGPEFYLKAMMYFRQRRPDLGRPIFLVVSDDILWVKKHLIQNDVFVVSEGDVEHPEQDLVLLSLCNHSIIDYGTYGLWAAVYAGGVTVTVKTSTHVYQTLGRKPNWHFVSVKPGKEIEIY